MAVEKSETLIEDKGEAKKASPGSAMAEANAGREDLYKKDNEEREEVKQGKRRSGISEIIGWVKLVVDEVTGGDGNGNDNGNGRKSQGRPEQANLALRTDGSNNDVSQIVTDTAILRQGDEQPQATSEAVNENLQDKQVEAAPTEEQLHHQELVDVAKAIHKASDGWGTDEETIKTLLEGKSKEDRDKISALYQQMYGIPLAKELEGEFLGNEQAEFLYLLNRTDEQQAADEIFQARDLLEPAPTMLAALEGKTPSQIKAMDEHLLKTHGISLEEQLKEECTEEQMQRAYELLSGGGVMGVLNDRGSSQEDKLRAAYELAIISGGEDTTFVGEDGRTYHVNIKEVGKDTQVSIHTKGDDGKSHAVLRGVLHPDGDIDKQQNSAGNDVPYASTWAEGHLKDSPILGSGETSREKQGVLTNDKGQVTKVTDAQGETYEFKYNRRGQVTEMSAPDGTWKSKDGVHWKNEKGVELEGKVEVKADGSIRRPESTGQSVEKVDGSEVHTAKDGSMDIQNTDGSTLKVEHGQITKVTYADGSERSFQYALDGTVNQVTDKDGTLATEDGQHWKNNKGEEWEGEISVDIAGNYHRKEANGETVELTDGGKAVRDTEGALRVTNADGQLTEVIDTNGRTQKFGYHSDGRMHTMTTPDGVVWETKDGHNWTNDKTDKVWKVSVSVEEDGTRKLTDEGGNEIVLKLDGSTEVRETNGRITLETAEGEKKTLQHAIDPEALEKTTDALVEAIPRNVDITATPKEIYEQWEREFNDPNASNADKARLMTIDTPDNRMRGQFIENKIHAIDMNTYTTLMRDKTDAERKLISDMYEKQTGETLEHALQRTLTGAELERALNLLHHGSADRVGRIHADLTDLEDPGGWSKSVIEKDLLDTLGTMSAKEIAELDDKYFAEHGVHLADALLQNEHLSEGTKQFLEVYLKGVDQRTDEDTLKLADIALEKESMTLFQQAFRDGAASPEARQYFLDHGGEDRVLNAFGVNKVARISTAVVAGAIGVPEEDSRMFLETTASRHAMDYARSGNLSLESQAIDNDGTFSENEGAIRHAAKVMPDDEREKYFRGKEVARQAAAQGLSVHDLTQLPPADREALLFYSTQRSALDDPLNATELAEEEATIRFKDQQIVSQIAGHRGKIEDDSVGDVISDIENMSKADWERAKNDPVFHELMLDAARGYLDSGEMRRLEDVLDKKLAADTYEKSFESGHRSVFEAMGDNANWFSADKAEVYGKAIINMTPEERELYRTDPEFRKKLDKKVDELYPYVKGWGGSPPDPFGQYPNPKYEQYLAIRHYLDEVARGEEHPPSEILIKLSQHPGRNAFYGAKPDPPKLIHDLEESLQKDPKLRERIMNPQTPEDKVMSELVMKSLNYHLSKSDLEEYAKPLLEDGRLPIEKQVKLDHEYESGHRKEIFEDLVQATPEEMDRLRNDPDYREQVLKPLSKEERQIAEYAIQQGEMRPEDIARAAMIGNGVDNEALSELTDGMSPEGKEQLKNSYAKKYGEDFVWRGLEETSGKAEREFKQDTRRDPTSKYELYDETRSDAYRSREGFGSSWVDNYWDGTGFQVDDALNAWGGALSDASRRNKDIPVEKQKELQSNLYESLDNFKESKEAMADAFTDGVIAAAALGGAFFTNGVSLELLSYVGIAGGTFKMTAKAAIMGEDYDWKKAWVDVLAGGADAALSFVGPAELAAVMGIGKKAATTAAIKTAEELGVKAGVRIITKEGEEVLEKGATKLVQDAVITGAPGIEDKAIRELAEQAVSKELTGEAREEAVEQVAKTMKRNLAEQIEVEGRSWLKRNAMQYGFEAGGGVIGGAAGGTVLGFGHWDSSKSFSENMGTVFESAFTSAAYGGAGAVAFTTAFNLAGTGYHVLTGGPDVKVNSPEVVAKEGDYALVRPKDAPPPEGAGIKPSDKFTRVGDSDYYAKDGEFYKLNEQGALVRDQHIMAAIKDDAVMNKPEFQFARMSPEKRAEILERVQKLEMAKEEGIDEFLDRFDKVLSGKEDMSPLVHQAETTQKELGNAWYNYEEEVILPLQGKVPDADLENPEAMRKHIANDPEKLKILDEYLEKRQENAIAQRALKEGADERKADIQKAMNDFTDSRGLPRVKVELGDLGTTAGQYSDGVITLNKLDVMSGKGVADLQGTAYHELVHSEQDSLVIRNLADEAGIGKTATPEDAKRLQDLYKQRTGANLSEEHLNEVLRIRQGEPLTPDEKLRAQELTEAWKNNSPVGPEFKEAGIHSRVVERELQLLDSFNDKNAAHKLIARLAEDKSGTLARHLFGNSIPPDVQALIELHKKNLPFPEQQAYETLNGRLSQRMTDLHEGQIKAYQKYIANVHEQEAVVIGHEVRARAEERRMAAVADETRKYVPGDRIQVGSSNVEVIGQHDNLVAVRHAEPSGPIEGQGIKPTSEQMKELTPINAGDTIYYRNDSTNTYYRMNKEGELVEDFDVEFIPREKLPAKVERTVSPEEAATSNGIGSEKVEEASAAHGTDTAARSLEPEAYLTGDKIALDGTEYKVAGFDGDTGQVILQKTGEDPADVIKKKPITLQELDANYREVQIGDETYYRDAQGRVYDINPMPGGRMSAMETQFVIVPRDQLASAQLLEAGLLRREQIKARAELDIREARRTGSIPIQGPDNTEVLIGDHRVALKDEMLHVGRQYNLGDGTHIQDTRVSRDHGTLRWDEKQGSFTYKDHSSHGTYIKREGSQEFELVKGKEVKLGPNDEVRLGSPDGPHLRLAGIPDEGVQAAGRRVDQQVFFDGKPVQLNPGHPVSVGREHLSFGNESDDIINAVVSRDHGTVGVDDQGRLIYTDHSYNGTYIKRAGSDKFEMIKGEATVIKPGDQVRLGSEFGPELKLSTVHGQTLQDGTVVFERAGEDVFHRPDGFVEISDRAGVYRVEDSGGTIVAARDSMGVDRVYSYASDGQLSKVEFSDGRVLERMENNSWKVTQPGAQPSDWTGKVEVEPDGSLRYEVEGAPPRRERLDGTTEILHPNGRIEYTGSKLEIEEARLKALADHHFENPQQKERFLKQMEDFEVRAKKAGLSEEEAAATYHQVNRLIQAGPDAPIGPAERVRLAEQILQQAGNPTSIDQGFNNTCNVTTIEARIFSREPSEAARLITDVATTGKYVTADGSVIDLGRVPGALDPDQEALMSLRRPFDGVKNQDIKVDGRRTYASQIFETTAVNIKWAQASDGPGEVIMYEKHGSAVPGATGERLVKYKANPDGSITRETLEEGPQIFDREFKGIYNEITGGNDTEFFIRGPGNREAPGNLINVESVGDFKRVLEQMESQKDFPVILKVHVGHPPFSKFVNSTDAGGNGGWHVITIEGIVRDPKGRIYLEVSNQWGSQSDHMGHRAIPIEQLFEATKPMPKKKIA